MRIRTVSALVAFAAMVAIASAQTPQPQQPSSNTDRRQTDRPAADRPSDRQSGDRPAGDRQRDRSNADRRDGRGNADRPEADRPSDRSNTDRPSRPETPRPSTNMILPTSPILPMTNPVAPITNPVAPIIRYGGTGTPTVVIPPATPARPSANDGRNPDRSRDQRRGNRDVPVILGGVYVAPDYLYYQQQVNPAPVPGQLPGVYRPGEEPASSAVPGTVPSPVSSVPAEPITYPEPNIIITPPVPDRVVEPPAIGTPRADLLSRYGQPWGSIWARGQETLYFSGGLTVVLQDSRVVQVR